MAVVAALAANAGGEAVVATITATFRRTKSAASAGSRSICLSAQTVFDRPILALDIAGVFESLTECAHPPRVRLRRLSVEKPDDRQRRLLRTDGERPCRSAAEQPYERAALHHSITS